MIAEISGPVAAIEALLGEADPVPRALETAGATPGEVLHPLLAGGLAAAREPAFRIWTEGVEPGVRILGGHLGALLLVDEPAAARTLLGVSYEEVPLVLVGAVALEPRPSCDEPAIRLGAPAMAELIGSADDHSPPRAEAEALKRRLEPGVRRWSVMCAGREGQGGEVPRSVEVIEGEGGIWRVRTVDDGGFVELAPTTSTAVLRDLVALLP